MYVQNAGAVYSIAPAHNRLFSKAGSTSSAGVLGICRGLFTLPAPSVFLI